ncbi:MAG: hypothetical protein ACYCXG_05310 [Acidiferrobacter sp.]
MNYTVIPSEEEELDRALQRIASAAKKLAELALHRESNLAMAEGNLRDAAKEFEQLCREISGRPRPVSTRTPAP